MAAKLTARKVATAKPGRHGDGAGLWLAVASTGAKKWVFRFSFGGKVTEMGLGSAEVVGLAQARERATEARQMVAAGKNPIVEKRQAKEKHAARSTFGDVADDLLAAKASEWRNEKHKAQWKMTLEVYAAPLRPKPVDEIDTEAVLSVLRPIWLEKPETASRLRGRIETVLDAARAKGHIPRNEANPARWRGHLDKLLPKRPKLSRGHHAAMDYADVPAFIVQLRERTATAALALEFTILTAVRAGEMRGAQWDEFDLEKKLWTIPANRMKAAREHRVPLSDRAAAIVAAMAEAKTGDFVFPGATGEKPLSVMALDMLLRRMGQAVTTHGFRSSFRDWAGNETHFAREVAEAALSHVIGDKAEQAYRRSDALEKRRALMDAWARHCEAVDASNVIPMKLTGD
ncbi:integrase [Rhodoblastus acidophilus]|uniref:tyrosine-type recombinase/integrase n=1 Tax=Rhodoblastus acidophilus TaxID=1074 RepID=UPI0022255EA6|nr:site-specific integrase [Rhodoblastus acidophilus]MCW2315707.1 integrase [Rhodoblastus acidophilus]